MLRQPLNAHPAHPQEPCAPPPAYPSASSYSFNNPPFSSYHNHHQHPHPHPHPGQQQQQPQQQQQQYQQHQHHHQHHQHHPQHPHHPHQPNLAHHHQRQHQQGTQHPPLALTSLPPNPLGCSRGTCTTPTTTQSVLSLSPSSVTTNHTSLLSPSTPPSSIHFRSPDLSPLPLKSLLVISPSPSPSVHQHHQPHHHQDHHQHRFIQQQQQQQQLPSPVTPGVLSPPTVATADSAGGECLIKGPQFGLSLSDFDLVCTLGTGTFGKVLLVKIKRRKNRLDHGDQHYAIKVLNKLEVVRLKQVEHINSEKDLLGIVTHRSELNRRDQILRRFVVTLFCTFQDERNVYMLMEFVPGGELFSHLRRHKKFKNDVTRFYACNVLLALDGLHSLDIIYRDLKPENILLGLNGYIKLTDFGFAKRVPDRTWTLCGTPEYLAPEIIQSKGHGKAVDWWAFGILIYEMLIGHPPFYNSTNSTQFEIYTKILNCQLQFPSQFHDQDGVQDLIERLLVIDRSKRLGNLKNGVDDIKSHPWFSGVDWDRLINQTIPAPIIPTVSNRGDRSNFDHYPEVRLDDLPGMINHPPLSHLPPSSSSSTTNPSRDPYGHLFETF